MENLTTEMAKTQSGQGFPGGGASFSSNDAGFDGFTRPKACYNSGIEKFRSLEVWQLRGFKRRLSWNFVIADFIKNLEPSKAFTMADRRSSRFHILSCALAFTMAEILISLTIIGVIAAITLPALQANINEKVWGVQKKALHSRMSQAVMMMGSLSGYGKLAGTMNTSNSTAPNITEDTAAETFLKEGLSKVFKMNNICDETQLKDCGLPKKFKTITGLTIELDSINDLWKFNNHFGRTVFDSELIYYTGQLTTKAAAFESANGESILTYYYPYCRSPLSDDTNVQPYMCANFIYDLNGKKGPNTIGKDMGFITAFYPTNSVIVAPMPFKKKNPVQIQSGSQGANWQNAKKMCARVGKDYRVPNQEELISMGINLSLLFNDIKGYFWTSDSLNETEAPYIHLTTMRILYQDKTESGSVLCVKR